MTRFPIMRWGVQRAVTGRQFCLGLIACLLEVVAHALGRRREASHSKTMGIGSLGWSFISEKSNTDSSVISNSSQHKISNTTTNKSSMDGTSYQTCVRAPQENNEDPQSQAKLTEPCYNEAKELYLKHGQPH